MLKNDENPLIQNVNHYITYFQLFRPDPSLTTNSMCISEFDLFETLKNRLTESRDFS